MKYNVTNKIKNKPVKQIFTEKIMNAFYQIQFFTL